MQISRQINLANIILHLQDSLNLYLIVQTNQGVFLYTIDSQSFEIINTVHLNLELDQHCQPLIDDDAIYLSTKIGQIICIDKFSGERLVGIDVGCMSPKIKLSMYKDTIISLCLVPLSSVPSNTVQFCGYDKYSGQKTIQTSASSGRYYDFDVDEIMALIIDNKIKLYNKTMIKSIDTQFIPHRVFASKNRYCIASNEGILSILDNDLNFTHKILIGSKINQIFKYNNELYICAKNGIHLLDIYTGNLSQISNINTSKFSKINNKMFAININTIEEINNDNKIVSLDKIENLWTFEKYVIYSTNKSVVRIDI